MAYHGHPGHQRHSNYWVRSSPAPNRLDSQIHRRLEWRPSQYCIENRRGELAYPHHERHSMYWERSSPTPNLLDDPHAQSSSKRHLEWRSSKRSLDRSGELEYPPHKRHCKYSERSYPTQKPLVSQFKRIHFEIRRSPKLDRTGELEYPRDMQNSKYRERSSSTQNNFHVPPFRRIHFEIRRSPKLDRGGGELEYPRDMQHSNYLERSSSTQNNFHVPPFRRIHLEHSLERSGKLVYPKGSIKRWFAVHLDSDDRFPSSIHLKPVSLQPIGQRREEKSHVLLNCGQVKDDDEVRGNTSRSPWDFVAENVWPDLLSSFEILRSKMGCQELENVKPLLVAKFGKTLFHVNTAMDYAINRKAQVSETALSELRKTFYTSVPTLYIEKLARDVAPNIGLDFDGEKEIYHVRLFDRTRANSLISCKCRVKEDKNLEPYQVKLIHQIRQMVIDISCLDKDVDLRLMLSAKRILTALTDDEMQRIKNLINSAILDPEVKGGLKWPEVEAHSGSTRYSVVEVWHTITKGYKSPLLRLKVRHADRYNFDTGTGAATMEVSLKLKRIVSELQELKVELDSVYNMFKNTLGMIWDNFLGCEQFLT